MGDLITKLAAVARDPARATDQGDAHRIRLVDGSPVIYVANPPLTMDAFLSHQSALGFELPPAFQRLYCAVGDGGFGPGYGLGRLSEVVASADELALYDRPLAARSLYPRLVRISDWGCGISSVVDCAEPRASVFRLDPNVDDPVYWGTGVRWVARYLYPEAESLESWLERWLVGEELFYTAMGFTGSDDPRLQL